MGLTLNQQWVISGFTMLAFMLSLNNMIKAGVQWWFPANNDIVSQFIFWGGATAGLFALLLALRLFILDTDGVRKTKEIMAAEAELKAQRQYEHQYDHIYDKTIYRKLRGV